MSYDKKGYPIREGDILKVYHFTDYKKRRHYMYKMAWIFTIDDGRQFLMAAHLGEDCVKGCKSANSYRLPKGVLKEYEIVQGYNCESDELDFTDRIRKKE